MRIVADDGPDALEPSERTLLREAADSVFFSEDLASDEEARDALAAVADLTGELVGSARWDAARAESALMDLESCGPPQLVRLGGAR
jgi:hypothetical protein